MTSPLGRRKLSDLEPRVAAAFRSHGQASLALREAVQSALYALSTAALGWTAHRALPWCARAASAAAAGDRVGTCATTRSALR